MPLDPVSRMFSWFNEAYKTPGAYTEEAFGAHFTEDAELIIDGRLVTSGLVGWARHFQAIQADGGEVEIVVPFKEVFQVGDKVYTYHLIRAERDGVAMRMLAAGHAILRDGKIASISLVRTVLDSSIADSMADPR
jgi:SnoaL-like domain